MTTLILSDFDFVDVLRFPRGFDFVLVLRPTLNIAKPAAGKLHSHRRRPPDLPQVSFHSTREPQCHH